jgi:hypothetical protein
MILKSEHLILFLIILLTILTSNYILGRTNREMFIVLNTLK